MAAIPALPLPDSEVLAALVGSSTSRLVYGVLSAPGEPAKISELKLLVNDSLGEDLSRIDLWLRELGRYYLIEASGRTAKSVTHLRAGLRLAQPSQVSSSATGGAPSSRSAAMRSMRQGSAQGWRQTGHRLQGTAVPGRRRRAEEPSAALRAMLSREARLLQAIRVQSTQIRAAVGDEEPQKRTGELLQELDGERVRSDLIEIAGERRQLPGRLAAAPA